MDPRTAQQSTDLVEAARPLPGSTVLIDALRGRPAASRAAALRRSGTEPRACVTSAEEIRRGLFPQESVARRLFNGLRLAPLGIAEGMQAGAWRRAFALRGATLHQADCLIAAAAAGVGATLAAVNVKDFPMTEIRAQYWPAGN